MPAASTFAPPHAAATRAAAIADFDNDDNDELLVEAPPLPHEIAADPALRCRYPSKHCERRRTTKKTGALHSMCAFHRAKANRNQRRLEKRKRFLKDEARLRREQPPGMTSAASTAAPTVMAMPYASPRDVDLLLFAHLEPFRSPVPLFKEDLEELCALVDFNVTSMHVSYTEMLEDPRQFRIV